MNSGVSWTLGRLRRVQRAGPDGEPVVPGEAQVRDRRRQPPVLPLQLEVPRHEPQEDRPRPPMSGGGGGSNARIERERDTQLGVGRLRFLLKCRLLMDKAQSFT